MEQQRHVVVATVRNRLQAEVLTGELKRRGIDAVIEEVGGLERRGPKVHIVEVAESQLEEARRVVVELSGRGAPVGLLDPRRLLPAFLALIALIALIAWLVDLFV